MNVGASQNYLVTVRSPCDGLVSNLLARIKGDYLNLSVAELQAAMAAGHTSVVELTRFCSQRIADLAAYLATAPAAVAVRNMDDPACAGNQPAICEVNLLNYSGTSQDSSQPNST
jgi:hypothetical protein